MNPSVEEALAADDPLAALGVVQLVRGAVEQHLEALHGRRLARCLAGVDVDRGDAGHLRLDLARGGKDVVPRLGLPVCGEPGLGKDVLVVPEGSRVGAVRDAVGLAVGSLRRALRGVDELAPLRPGLEIAVERLEVAGLDVGVDQEGVFVDQVRGGPRRAQHQRELRVVVVLRGHDRQKLHLLAGVVLLEARLHAGQEVGHHLALAELLVGHLDCRAAARAAAGPATGRHDQGECQDSSSDDASSHAILICRMPLPDSCCRMPSPDPCFCRTAARSVGTAAVPVGECLADLSYFVMCFYISGL